MLSSSSRPWEYALSAYILAGDLEMWGEPFKAKCLLAKAVSIKKCYASDLVVANMLDALANLRSRLGEVEEAVAACEQALEARLSDSQEPTPSELCEALHRLGALYLSSGRAHKAVPLLERAVSVAKEEAEEMVKQIGAFGLAIYLQTLSEAYGIVGRQEDSYATALESDRGCGVVSGGKGTWGVGHLKEQRENL